MKLLQFILATTFCFSSFTSLAQKESVTPPALPVLPERPAVTPLPPLPPPPPPVELTVSKKYKPEQFQKAKELKPAIKSVGPQLPLPPSPPVLMKIDSVE
jgi:hypothetical protein